MMQWRLLKCLVGGAMLLALPWTPAIAAAATEEACATAGSAPSCVAKAWFGCAYFSPTFCDLIGISPKRHYRSDLPDLGPVTMLAKTAPWKLKFEQLFAAMNNPDAEWSFAGARKVTAGRFKSALPHDPNLEGTAEVMLEAQFGDNFLTFSVFAKQIGDEWRFASWSQLDGMYDSLNDRDVLAKIQECDSPQGNECDKYLRRLKSWRQVGPDGAPRKKEP